MKKYAMGGRMMRPEREPLAERIKARKMPGLKPVPEEPMYKKGGKIADKAGRAMKKRSADTMGRAMVKKMAIGGSASAPREDFGRPMMPSMNKDARREAMEKRGSRFSAGGSVFRKAADGVATKGKTKGKMVKMNKGGYCG